MIALFEDRNSATFMLMTLCLLSIGLLMVNSASIEIASVNSNSVFHYSLRHGIYLVLALVLAAVAFQVPVDVWRLGSRVFLLIGLVGLLAVLIPGIGKTVNGSTRWIAFAGFTVQPSEFAKFSIVVYVADYLSRYQQQVKDSWWGMLKPLVVCCVMALALLLEPDFGTAFVIFLCVAAMLFFAGAALWRFVVLAVPAFILVWFVAVSQPYRVARLTSFVDPWQDQFSTGYQLVQSLIAIGRGNFFGQGLGNSIQKMFYLPEAHTDFVVAVLGEEFGALGLLVLIACFFVLLASAIAMIHKMMAKAENNFACYLVFGLLSLLFIQAFVNMGVNVGVLPTKGITLPLVSYGGSSLIVSCVSLSVALRAYYESCLVQKKRLSL